MDTGHFDAGIRHLEIMFAEALDSERRKQYFRHLQGIPNDLWDAGIFRVTDQVRFHRFPLVAEIGEACMPGSAETEDLDPWTRRWVKRGTPWSVRLAALLQPALTPPASQLQIPGPRDPLSVHEQKLMERCGVQVPTDSMRALVAHPASSASLTDQECTDICQHLLSLDPECGPLPRTVHGRRVAASFFLFLSTRAHREHVPTESEVQSAESQQETVSPYASGHIRTLMNAHSRESRAVRNYWTPERTDERTSVLHRQLLWIKRRDEAEQSGQQFTEPRPE